MVWIIVVVRIDYCLAGRSFFEVFFIATML